MPSKTILVVDDNFMNQRMAELILAQEDYFVVKAKSGMECLMELQHTPVDLILLDLEMPIMDGVQTLEIIKKNKQWMNIPVIILTASADVSTVKEVSALGIIDYIKKPIQQGDLVHRVKKALQMQEHDDDLIL